MDTKMRQTTMKYRSACPVCHHDSYMAVVFDGKGKGFKDQRVIQCLFCSHHFHNPYDFQAAHEEYVQNSYSISERRAAIPDAEHIGKSMIRATERVAFLKEFADEEIAFAKSIIEQGSGDGAFLKIMTHEEGAAAAGVELSKGYVEWAKENYAVNLEFGDSIYHIKGEELDDVSLFAMFHVIEHLVDPFKVISIWSDLLRDWNYIVLEIPNLYRASKRSNLNPYEYFHKYHLHDFTHISLDYLMGQHKMKRVAQKQWGNFPQDKNELVLYQKTPEYRYDLIPGSVDWHNRLIWDAIGRGYVRNR